MLRYSHRGRRGSDDEDVKLFVSQSDMNGEATKGRRGRQPKPELQREYSDLTKKKHEQIVKKLLEEFDLEETKQKYRGAQDDVNYVPKPKGLADYQFRSDLRRIMGSDVIHLNDRKWNEELHQRLREEYEKRLDRKEEELARAEAMRVRKLKLDGIISMTDENDVYEHDHVTKKNTGKAKGKRRKGHNTRRKRSRSPSAQRARCNSAPSRSITLDKASDDVPTQVELMDKSAEDGSEHGEQPNNQPQSKTKEKSVESKHNKTKTRSEPSSPEAGGHRDTSSNVKHDTSSNVKHKKLPEEIKELYQEETVEGLYSMAARLVIPDTRPTPKPKKQGYQD